MKILITADLHYDLGRSRAAARELAARVCAAGGDAVVLVGDTAGARLHWWREALGFFAGFDGRKLLVPGNHCLWCREGEDSIDRYERVLPEVAGEFGFELLDHAPVVLDGVALVGSVGWYDYSFREACLGIPTAFYRAKVAPGADRIAAFIHHLPFEVLVPRGRPDRFAFAAAFMGSQRLGKVLLDCDKVREVYCGHSHWRARARVGRVEAINVGSTYTTKRLEVLEI